jgi:hypothetical protein
MLRKVVSGIMLTLLLISMLTFAFNIQPVVGIEEPIYSRIDNPNPSIVNSTLIWTVSPTDFGTLYVLPGQSVDLVVTISNSPLSDTAWEWSWIAFGWWYGNYGDLEWGSDIPTIEPGNSWTGTIIRFTVFSTTPLGTNVTCEGCSLWICPIGPAQPEYYRIPITIIAGPPPPSIPVGGYSFPIQVHTKTEPIIPYIALVAILTAIFTKLRPKTRRKR